MAKGQVASFNPDNFIQGGLKDDFTGVITKVRLVPWDYDGKIDHHVLAAAVTIKLDEPDDPKEAEFTQHYSAGDLEQFVPSMDGETSVPLDRVGAEGYDPSETEGIYALKVGKKDGLSGSSNWAHFIGAAIDAGFPKNLITAEVSFLEGVHAHFNRVPQKKRSGLVNAKAGDDNKRANDILVITEIKALPGAAKATGAKAAPAAPKSPSASPAATGTATAASAGGNTASGTGGSDLDAKLAPIVVAAVKAAGEAGLSKSKLPTAALKSLAAADKGKGVKRVVETAFLESLADQGVVFDADSGTLMYAGE